MLTIRAEVLKDKKRMDGTYNVKVRFIKDKKVKRVSTDLFATDSDLTSDLKLKEESIVKQEADRLVLHYRTMVNSLHFDSENCDVSEIVNRLLCKEEAEKPIDFIAFSKKWISKTTIKGKDNYTTALNSFIRFLGKEELEIKKITVDLLEQYRDYIINVRNERVKALQAEGKRVPSNRCLSLYLMSLRHLYGEAQRFYNKPDKGLMRIPHTPFEYFKIPKQEATRKRAVTPQQIKAIWSLPYQNIHKGVKHTCRPDLAKDCFILSFCLMGINSADLYNATLLRDNRLVYCRTKTKERRLDKAKMEVVVPDMVLPIIEKYRDTTGQRLFRFYKDYRDHKAFNKAINKGLKGIGDQLNIDDLEFYAARHSWATIALNKCGIDKYTVHAALNHVDESMRVTDIYIERDFVNENKANAKVIKYVFGK
ncbi:MAG: phage integrase SAM-like domain-containing protein [Prevotellaceae bacterium]|nr:phage integrase SAM-like domain-containing protein [Prevotellaceae bacterium]